jgi:hypothetical protein
MNRVGRYDISPAPVIEAYKKDVDRTLLRENLKLTVEERFLELMALQRAAEEMQRAGAQARHDRSQGHSHAAARHGG